jgi:hypothetical protein
VNPRARVLTIIGLLSCSGLDAVATNIDPADDGSHFAWGENIGWLNAKPGGVSGDGVVVGDFDLTGWMWSENAGWISLSCKNTSSCAASAYGVTNDGAGHLGGFAWGENIGWINFAPNSAGVTVNPSTGIFNGYAWSENAGWISFNGAPPNAFNMGTAWRCDPTLARPTQSPRLSVSKTAGTAVLTWTSVPLATGYDVIKGSLEALRTSGGDFGQSTMSCMGNNSTLGSVSDGEAPSPNGGFWYLARAANCAGSGTYDSGQPSQIRSRDAGIANSGRDCPSTPWIVFDSANASNDLFPTVANPRVSYSHSVAAGLAKATLLVFISGKQGPGAPEGNCRAVTVTYAGVPLVSGGVATAVDSSDFKSVVEAWYLVSPASGANAVEMTFPGACPAIQSHAISLGNVDQLSPIRATASSTITGMCPVSCGNWSGVAFSRA